LKILKGSFHCHSQHACGGQNENEAYD